MSVFGITLLSIKRRMPQIIKAACTTLAAVFFVTAVLIFQENMYQWQMSYRKGLNRHSARHWSRRAVLL